MTSDAVRIATLEASLSDVSAYLDELRKALAGHDSALGSIRLAELERRISPVPSHSAPSRRVGSDAVANTLGNVNPYPSEKNLLLDPTLESVTGNISGTEAAIGFGSHALAPAWYGKVVSGCGAAPYIRVSADRDDISTNTRNTAIVEAYSDSVLVAGTHEIMFRSATTRVYTADKRPFLVASVRANGGSCNQWGNVTSLTATLEIYDSDDATVRATTTESINYIGPLTCSMLLSGQAWAWHYFSLRLRVTMVTSGTLSTYFSFRLAEPQLVQSHTDDAPPFHPLLGAWTTDRAPSAAQVLTAGTALLANADVVMFTCTGAVTTTATPTVADGADGKMVTAVNVGTGTWTIQDQGTLASSNLRLNATTIAIGPRQSVRLMYSATVGDWVQVGPLVAVI